MPNWIKKSFVILISILTFGMISPQDLLAGNNQKTDEQQFATDHLEITPLPALNKEQTAEQLISQAKEITATKLGERILPRIESDFESEVIPKIEEIIMDLFDTYPEEEITDLAISPVVGKGDGERIFHIMDTKSNDEILYFHVRKDRPPLEGYSFNFHYHSAEDGFETHHELAEIYWGKDTPARFGSEQVH
ncbi:hypothetical protein KP77_20770 [Jeotgalibacillus alimentarius]|uniref:YpjP-like protein n=1 Tax=Jeotgalibacillus alimentarius TaxID=135826 RepID=A0A0C2VWT6_9BACL|nr:YpjP family protein [Jeotgalibacillus alimentarius]KIL48866.1 hypothetical protein KP77_20770 [Jeotgalibacillus alimentarius]